MVDDIAHNHENPHPGTIINRPDGPDVYHGVPKVCGASPCTVLPRCVREEHIVVFMVDDIAHSHDNPHPGTIINLPDGSDVYHGVPKDYTGRHLTVGNFFAALLGNASAINHPPPLLVPPNPSYHVFLFSHLGVSLSPSQDCMGQHVTQCCWGKQTPLPSTPSSFPPTPPPLPPLPRPPSFFPTSQDYTGRHVTVHNFIAALLGNASAINGGSGKVIASGPNDHVFVYYTDHGGPCIQGVIASGPSDHVFVYYTDHGGPGILGAWGGEGVVGCMGGWMGGWVHGWMHEWVAGWVHESSCHG
ncbi:unnamed protein product [Closterium sp. NIES-53]